MKYGGNTTALKLKHLLLALLTVLIWGLNFIAIHYGLKTFPPFLLCAVRFALAAVPFVFFLPRPKAPLKFIMGYGIFTFAMQFGLLFTGIHLGLSPGLASLVLQVQVFFSMGLAALLFNDRPGKWKIIGALIAFVGLALVASRVGGGTTLVGFILMLFSALAWAIGNMFSKKVAADSPLALVAWGNLIALPFMVVASLATEGVAVITTSFANINIESALAVLYIVYMSTTLGYGIWGFLLNSYSTNVVVPFTLLVPVIGLLSSAIFLNEQLPAWKLIACVIIMAGLIFNQLEKQVRDYISRLGR
ncbi:MAG: EamA family transporter [Bacteroidota bacterium]